MGQTMWTFSMMVSLSAYRAAVATILDLPWPEKNFHSCLGCLWSECTAKVAMENCMWSGLVNKSSKTPMSSSFGPLLKSLAGLAASGQFYSTNSLM